MWKQVYCMIDTVKCCDKTIHNDWNNKIICLCSNIFLYQWYNILFFDHLSITQYNKFCQIQDLSFRGSTTSCSPMRVSSTESESMSWCNFSVISTAISTTTRWVAKLTLYFNEATRERQPRHHPTTVVRLAKQPFQQDQSGVISMPCATPTPPEFSFDFTDKGAAHNLEVLRKYNLDSILYGIEWKPSSWKESNGG